MLAFLLTRLHLASLLPDKGTDAVPWLVAGLAVWLMAIVLATVRWQRVLSAIDLPSPLPSLLSHSLAGLFVANFLPTTVGGDVLRVVRLSADNGERPRSFASVVLERLTGFVVLPLISLVALATHPALLHLGNASRLALLLPIASLVALVVILAGVASPWVGRHLEGKASWRRFVNAVHLGLDRLRRHPAQATGVLVIALAYQLAVVLAAWLATKALGIHLSWGAALAFVPVVAIAQVLPVSVSGLGLREGALVILLQPLGVGREKAVALGLLLYGMNLAVSLLGAPAFAVGPRDARALASSLP